MSLGNTYNNPGNPTSQKVFDPTVYSAYRMNNAESSIDPTCLTFRFWKNNLCISISPRKNTGTDEVQFDMDNGITIYLSFTKARILAEEIKKFLQNPIAYNNVGTTSGQSAITISNGSEYGKNTPVLTIRKVTETGEVVSSFAYEFKRNYYYSIRNYDGNNFDKNFDDYNNIEIESLVNVLEKFYDAATGAVAFSIVDATKYSNARTEKKIDAIAAALGVETAKSNGQRKYNNNSFFNNNSGSNAGYSATNGAGFRSTASIDDIE